MNRPIKFRGLTTTGIWCFGYYSVTKLGQSVIHLPDGLQSVVREETVSQFTGLLDKNGKEIYEGDIVKSKGVENTMVVEWSDIEASDDMTAPGVGFQFNTEPSTMEVIGNIYENADLLK